METPELDDRLSRISTKWTMILQAHAGAADGATAAQQQLLQRYIGAVYRYLLGAVHDPEAADDLAQEFALRFMRGDFRRADPERGRFRDYLKAALIHLVRDYHRARAAWPRPLAGTAEPAVPPPTTADAEETFAQSWREDLLERTWKALAAANPSYRAVLGLRVDEPELSSSDMAARLSGQLGQPISADGVRKTLERAHKKFAELLVEEVAASMGDATQADLEAELREFDVLKYCRSALARRTDLATEAQRRRERAES
jgi:RNA polymerase sigma factor (sigma-70 family)